MKIPLEAFAYMPLRYVVARPCNYLLATVVLLIITFISGWQGEVEQDARNRRVRARGHLRPHCPGTISTC